MGPASRKRDDASAASGDAQGVDAATEESGVTVDPLELSEEEARVEAEPSDGFQTEPSDATDEEGVGTDRDTHVLKMLYKGSLAEINNPNIGQRKRVRITRNTASTSTRDAPA